MITESETGTRYRVLGITICALKCFYLKVTDIFKCIKISEIIIAIFCDDNGDGRRYL